MILVNRLSDPHFRRPFNYRLDHGRLVRTDENFRKTSDLINIILSGRESGDTQLRNIVNGYKNMDSLVEVRNNNESLVMRVTGVFYNMFVITVK